MSESVVLYSSHSISRKEVNTSILATGGIIYTATEKSKTLGRIEDNGRIVYIFGDREPPDPKQFWEKERLSVEEESLRAIENALGEAPATALLLQIGHVLGSGLLAVEFAYQCAIRWPCVVWAEAWSIDEGDYIERVYTKEDMERLRVERRVFTSTVPIVADDGE